MKSRIAAFVLTAFLFNTPLNAFCEELINKEYAVIDNKNIIIYEKPDLFSPVIKYSKTADAVRDTVEITEKSGEFYQIKFFLNEYQYKTGWILETSVNEKITIESIIKYNIDINERNIFQRINDIKSHPEWGAIEKTAVYNSEILNGMNSEMVLASIGEPTSTNQYFTSSALIEQWSYNKPPENNFVLNFEKGVITSYKHYDEQINLKFQKELSKRKKYPYRKSGIELMALGGATFALSYAFLRDSDDRSIFFSSEHKTVSWIILSTVIVSEGVGIYLYQYSKDYNEIAVKTGSKKIELVYKQYF